MAPEFPALEVPDARVTSPLAKSIPAFPEANFSGPELFSEFYELSRPFPSAYYSKFLSFALLTSLFTSSVADDYPEVFFCSNYPSN